MDPLALVRLAEDLRSGAAEPRAVLAALDERVRTVEPLIESLLPEPGREKRLSLEYERLLLEYPSAKNRPALFAVPFGVKDIFRVQGVPTRAGSRLPAELFAGEEASAVTRLRVAGAVVYGKTVTTEFAVFHPGPTRNPHDLSRTPGGSSSGSAAAVAAGLLPFALGTQTIGSIIRPAAFCGVVGVKPSRGRVPADGVVPCSPSLDTVGYFAGDVAGATRVAEALYPYWDPTNLPAAESPLLAIPDGPYLEQASTVGRLAFQQQITRLNDAGYEVRRIGTLADIDVINQRHRALMLGEMARVHAAWFAQYGSLYAPATADLIRFGENVSNEEMERARAGRERLQEDLHAIMDREGIDLWISPSAAGPAPEGIDATGDPAMNLPWTHAGLPTVSLPAGTVEGLPVGLQVSGRFGGDEALLQWAEGLSRALKVPGL